MYRDCRVPQIFSDTESALHEKALRQSSSEAKIFHGSFEPEEQKQRRINNRKKNSRGRNVMAHEEALHMCNFSGRFGCQYSARYPAHDPKRVPRADHAWFHASSAHFSSKWRTRSRKHSYTIKMFKTITSKSLIFSNFALSASYCLLISSNLSWKREKT